VSDRPALTNDEIVSLASSLRGVGVSRFQLGDLTVEFEPRVEPELTEQPEPAEETPMEKAARMLGNRGRAA